MIIQEDIFTLIIDNIHLSFKNNEENGFSLDLDLLFI
jgi:hypothetical protein